MRPFICYCCGVLALLLPETGMAQTHISFAAGYAYTYNKPQKAVSGISGVLLPQAALDLSIPLGRRIGLEAGLGYRPKGFNFRFDWRDSANRYEQREQDRFQVLSVPLCLGWQAITRNRWALRLSGGLHYNFLLRATADYELKVFKDERLAIIRQSSRTFRTGLIQQNPANGSTFINYFLFQPSLAAALYLTYGRHLGAALSYDHYLYNAYAAAVTRKVLLRSVGLSLEWRW